MTTTNTTIDPRAKRWGTFAKWAAMLTIGFFVAPYIWVAIGGLIGMIVAGGILLATWMLLPAAEAAAANMRLKLIKQEAARNPVETLQIDLRNKTVALDERKTAIERLNGQIRTFADKVDEIKNKYGVQDGGYIKLNEDLGYLRRVALQRAAKWKEAHAQLIRYGEEIDRASMIWDAGQAAAAARESSGFTEEDFYAKLRSETAFDSISNSYNEALASLDTSMLEADPVVQASLPAPKGNTIDLKVNTKLNAKA